VVCDATLGQVFFLQRVGGAQSTSWVLSNTVGTGGGGALVDGAAGVAVFSNPHGVTELGDAVYVADTGSNAVRRISAAFIVSTPVVGLHSPMDVAGCEQDTCVFIADTMNNKVKKLDLASGFVSDFAGSGDPGVSDGKWDKAAFFRPAGLAVEGRTVYVVDMLGHTARIICPVDNQASARRTVLPPLSALVS